MIFAQQIFMLLKTFTDQMTVTTDIDDLGHDLDLDQDLEEEKSLAEINHSLLKDRP